MIRTSDETVNPHATINVKRLLPSEIAKLSVAERNEIYSNGALAAKQAYSAIPELTIFNSLDGEAFLGKDE